MRGLALCLVAGALFVAGCGSSDNSAKAPAASTVASTTAGSGQSGAVSAAGAATPASLCSSEGKGKSKKQCTAGLKKLQKGKAKNPRAACKGLSKKKTKGVKGKSPYAVCVAAAGRLMAAKTNTSGNGAADSSGDGSDGSDSSGTGTNGDATDSSAGGDEVDGLTCVDAAGNEVPIDSPDVDSCDDSSVASDSSAGDGTDTSSGDSPDDGN